MVFNRSTMFCALIAIALTITACGHRSEVIAPERVTSVKSLQAQSPAATLFGKVKGKHIADSDIEKYIDSSVTGSDRILAHKLLGFMPENERGDFIYTDNSNRLLSNNRALLQYVERSHGLLVESTGTPMVGASGRQGLAARRVRNLYHDSCSPPDPYVGSGPYLRMVSACGYAGAIGFVNIACGTTALGYGGNGRDSGTVYMELANGPSYGASLIEGGLSWLSDRFDPSNPSNTGIYPYYRSTFGRVYESLNNRNFHYDCGQDLVIAHGMVYGAKIIYTFIAQAPNDFDPRFFWSGGKYLNWQNPSWNFHQAPPDMDRPGTDGVGVPTPCITCSISKVTSIAQNGSESNDGSSFGESLTGGEAVHWMQVAFGEWLQGCGPNAQFCYLRYSRDYRRYYGGEQIYNALSGVGTIKFNGPASTGLGPWETYDGISVRPASSYGRAPQASGPFMSPLPPTCVPDSYGYCTVSDSGPSSGSAYCIGPYGDQMYWYPDRPQHEEYIIQTPTQVLESYTHRWDDDGTGSCTTVESWAPAEPSLLYGDPNLP